MQLAPIYQIGGYCTEVSIFGARIFQFDGHDVLATGLFDGHYTISTSSELISLHDSRVADGL